MAQLHGVGLLAAIPGRAENSDRSEMVTQLLFGEYYTVLQEEEKWIKIRCHHDNYECWIDRGQHTPVDSIPESINLARPVLDPVNYLITGSETLLPVTAGALLPLASGETSFELAGNFYKVAHQLNVGPIPRDQMLALGLRMLNTPYLWGGRSAFGIDCSGLMQLLFRAVNIDLPRDASQQIEVGSEVDGLQNSQSGDMAFFNNAEGKITHVGLLLGDGKILHASSRVKIESIDEEGIRHEETGKLTHRLSGVRRVD
jgi:hypothetical protein